MQFHYTYFYKNYKYILKKVENETNTYAFGGESQRLKLVKHLLKDYRGHSVYFLDEPTVGLHMQDIEKLLRVLKVFLERGDTILMIEHDQSILQYADEIIRLENGKVVG
jgi:excinuclease ABC subunit A